MDSLDQVLNELKHLRRVTPNVDYSSFWNEINRATLEENKAFDEEDKILKMSTSNFHKSFTI